MYDYFCLSFHFESFFYRYKNVKVAHRSIPVVHVVFSGWCVNMLLFMVMCGDGLLFIHLDEGRWLKSFDDRYLTPSWRWVRPQWVKSARGH